MDAGFKGFPVFRPPKKGPSFKERGGIWRGKRRVPKKRAENGRPVMKSVPNQPFPVAAVKVLVLGITSWWCGFSHPKIVTEVVWEPLKRSVSGNFSEVLG